ncbi:MAG: protein kinase [Cytophagaceae bacterium]|nr:protein kinase [Cytophagaceae bacterium]
MEGRLIQQYRLDALLGQGGMGTVFRATDTQLERTVAVKMLHPHLLSQGLFMERFRNEALILARLNHPNLAVLFNLLKEGTDQFMVMEYIEGESLEKLIQKAGALPPAVAAELVRQGLEGLHHAHRKGILHRDIKPANLMVTPEGVVKLMDFGIARVAGGERLTQINRVVGTLEYMAPELLQGQEPSPASDVYAMGILLYELLSGKVPFASRTDQQLMQAILHDKPISLRKLNEQIPNQLEAIVCKAIEKTPAKRYADAKEFQKALQPYFSGAPVPDLALINSLGVLPMTDVLDIQPKRPVNSTLKSAQSRPAVERATDVSRRWLRQNGQLFLIGLILLAALSFVGLILYDVYKKPLVPSPDSASGLSVVPKPAVKPKPDEVATTQTPLPVSTTRPEPEPQEVPIEPVIRRKSEPGRPNVPVSSPKEKIRNEVPTPPVSGPVIPQPTPPEPTTAPIAHPAGRKSMVLKRVRVSLALTENLSSADSRQGQSVRFRVTESVVSEGEVVIRAGATAYGEVTRIKRAGDDLFRKKDLLEFQIHAVEAANGQRIPLRSATMGDEARGHPVVFRSGQTFEVRTGDGVVLSF